MRQLHYGQRFLGTGHSFKAPPFNLPNDDNEYVSSKVNFTQVKNKELMRV